MIQRRDEEIRTLRKSGRLDEAFELAQQSLEEAVDNIWLKREIGWVYYAKAKSLAEIGEIKAAIEVLKLVAALGFAASEESLLAKQLPWVCAAIAKHFADTYKGKEKDSDFYCNAQHIIDTLCALIEVMEQLPLAKPSNGYSLFITHMHKLLKDRPGYAAIFSKIGFENFSAEDCKPFRTESGRSILPMAEQVYLAYTKALLLGFKQNSSVAIPLAEEFLPILNRVKISNPEYTWTDYNITKLLIALTRTDEAKQFCVDFIKRKSKEFWAWESLGQIYETSDTELSVACYCMALSCNADEEFLVSVMEGAAKAFAKAGYFNEARTEVDRVAKIRLEKWGKISASLATLKQSDWYKQATSLDNNNAFYNEHKDAAIGVVFSTQKAIIITHLNTEKKMASYITEEGKVGFFNYSRLKKCCIKESNIYLTTFVKESASGPSDVFSLKEIEECANYPTLRKEVCGTIKVLPAEVGFVEHCFVPSHLIQQYELTSGHTIAATAVRSYDRKKSALGWAVVSIK